MTEKLTPAALIAKAVAERDGDDEYHIECGNYVIEQLQKAGYAVEIIPPERKRDD